MSDLTDKQREALEALRDVMREHDVLFEQSYFEPIGLYAAGGYIGSNDSFVDITINNILEQHKEPTPEPPKEKPSE